VQLQSKARQMRLIVDWLNAVLNASMQLDQCVASVMCSGCRSSSGYPAETGRDAESAGRQLHERGTMNLDDAFADATSAREKSRSSRPIARKRRSSALPASKISDRQWRKRSMLNICFFFFADAK
jgi:hypothetical protein